MSVEPCIIRVTPGEFSALRERPGTLCDFIEDGYESGAFNFDWEPSGPLTRMLHLNEFATSLLAGFDDETPPCRALFGWDEPLLLGASHGHGGVYYHDPERVRSVYSELVAVPQARLRERFEGGAEQFRLAASGVYDGDEKILALQMAHFRRLLEFYRGAAEQGDFVLLMLV